METTESIREPRRLSRSSESRWLGGVCAGLGRYFDLNPTVDRVRSVSDTQQNIRLHPDLGTVVGTDMTLNPPGGVSAIAYTNSYTGALKTTLYGIDVVSNRLIRVGGPDGNPSPNTGMLQDVGPLGVDPLGAAGFDILWMGGKNLAFLIILPNIVGAVLLPIILFLMLRLINTRRLMGDYTNSRLYNGIAWITTGILIALSVTLLVMNLFT